MAEVYYETAVHEDDKIEGVLKPVGYRVLVRILAPEETSQRWKDSQLVMPDETRDREQMGQLWGLVLDLGPDAYKDLNKFPSGPWCKPGDAVVIRPYAGTRFRVRGELYALINDDTVQAVSREPGELERV